MLHGCLLWNYFCYYQHLKNRRNEEMLVPEPEKTLTYHQNYEIHC